jgi:hypothetical protein
MSKPVATRDLADLVNRGLIVKVDSMVKAPNIFCLRALKGLKRLAMIDDLNGHK